MPRLPLTQEEATVGRDPNNVVAISDPSVSRKHCLLRREDDGRFQIKDLDSRNGTVVNGVAVKEQWLRHGDEIATGDSVFLFLVEEDERALPASRVEFDDRKPTAETRVINPKEVVYLQPDRLLRELPSDFASGAESERAAEDQPRRARDSRPGRIAGAIVRPDF